MAGKILKEVSGREGYWPVGKGPVVHVGREGLESEELGDDKQVGQVADTFVDYMLAGMGRQGVADKDWREDKHWLGFAGSGRHASLAALASHRLAGGMVH